VRRKPLVVTLAWITSIGLHAAVAGYVYWSTSTPELGFEFTLPTEVEFGLTDAVEVSQGAGAAPPSAAAAQAAKGAGGEGPGAALDGGVPADAAIADAGVDGGPEERDAGPRRRREQTPREPVARADETEEPFPRADETEEQGPGSGEEGEGRGETDEEGRGVAFLPAGSQIALRLDVARIRRSALGSDVRQLLDVIPDWQAVIGGSGIDPLDDLDRVLIATPNFDRARVIAAGRARGGEDAIRAATEHLADGEGASADWRRAEGVPVADWHDHGPTDRVIALVGPSHFVISRPQDLSRVLGVARARADEQREEGAVHPADALLSMDEGEGLSLEIEGARNFARASRRRRGPIEAVPTRLRLALSELPDGVAVRSTWTYEDEAQAERAQAFWDRMREGYARNVITAVLGLAPILQRARIEQSGSELTVRVDLSNDEMRHLVSLVRDLFQDRARARSRAASPSPALPRPAELER